MRVNRILIWAGYFAIYYPITALMVRILHPSHGFMPDWMFAGINAFGWTYMVPVDGDKLQYEESTPARIRRVACANLKIALRCGVLALAAGVVAHLWVGRPTWIEIVGYAVAIGLSIVVSNVLMAASGLSVPDKRESQ